MGPSVAAPGYDSNDEYPTFPAITALVAHGRVREALAPIFRGGLEAGGQAIDIGDGDRERRMAPAAQR